MRRQVAAVLVACVAGTLGQLTADMETMLSWCLDGRHHKTRPGPEDQLHKECTPWKTRACCTANTTRSIHTTNLYGFTYDHCPGRRMSEKCRKHFVRDLCFHECSPNVGPWVTKVNMKIRNERFFEVPLCASQCVDWFEDCKNDYTCTDNWTRNFRWKNGSNHCPAGAECYTIGQVYGTAKHFCETVWDHSWKYTADDQPCMQIWFQPDGGNPNEAVARLRALQLTGTGIAPRAAAASAAAAATAALLLF